MTLKDRLLQYIAYKDIDKAYFERKSNLSNGFVDKAGNNTRTSSLDRISNSFPDLSIAWLRTGEGEMIKSSTTRVDIVGDGNMANSGNIGGDIIVNGASEFNNIKAENLRLKKEIEQLKKDKEQLTKDKEMLQSFIEVLQKKK